MTRLGRSGPVHLWEEPIFEVGAVPRLIVTPVAAGVHTITALLPNGLTESEVMNMQRLLLDEYIERTKISEFVAWYYTPMALRFSDHLDPLVTVYDCMDELSGFQGAPPQLVEYEHKLFAKAEVVFAGGASLYASKRAQHSNVHFFPSSIDYAHFAAARQPLNDPEDQKHLPHPRIGFYGVLDERLDRDLLREVASEHPEWQFILVGPVVKISQEDLPRGSNLHYLGQKKYDELPTYLTHWDVAMLPFARNSSTRFISPTKTPEYLAAGRPVVSTPIQDVVDPYATMGLVHLGASASEFADAIDICLKEDSVVRIRRVDQFLQGKSWNRTFEEMWEEVQQFIPLTSPHVSHEAVTSTIEEHCGCLII